MVTTETNLFKLFYEKKTKNKQKIDKTSVESVKLGKPLDLSENLSWKFPTPF